MKNKLQNLLHFNCRYIDEIALVLCIIFCFGMGFHIYSQNRDIEKQNAIIHSLTEKHSAEMQALRHEEREANQLAVLRGQRIEKMDKSIESLQSTVSSLQQTIDEQHKLIQQMLKEKKK